MQGDIIVMDTGPVCVVSHACSIRRGNALQPTQIVAPIFDKVVPAWRGYYDWMPLPGIQIDDAVDSAACIQKLYSIETLILQKGKRLAVMADTGVCVLQQRMAFHICRVIIPIRELEEYSAPVLAEAELHEEWVSELGQGFESKFFDLLDKDRHTLRNNLRKVYTRPKAMRAVRRKIKDIKATDLSG